VRKSEKWERGSPRGVKEFESFPLSQGFQARNTGFLENQTPEAFPFAFPWFSFLYLTINGQFYGNDR
jgi:hypothetical protein